MIIADEIKKAQEEIEAKADDTQDGALPDEEASAVAGGSQPEQATAPDVRHGINRRPENLNTRR